MYYRDTGERPTRQVSFGVFLGGVDQRQESRLKCEVGWRANDERTERVVHGIDNVVDILSHYSARNC